jgi:hypothetical protein
MEMMKMRMTTLGIVSIGLCVGCGGSKPAAQGPAAPQATTSSDAPKDDVLRPITQGQLTVSHYASRDGTLGLVLDRSGPHPKARMDGEKDIVELTMMEDRSAGGRRGWYLKTPTGSNMLYLGVNGNLKLFTKRDTFPLNSDKAADPLPSPTITGQYHEPKSSYQATIEQLTTNTVLKRLQGYKPQDSGNLAKVQEALLAAPPEMFVHLTDAGAKAARWAPASAHIDNVNQGLGGAFRGAGDVAWDPKGKTGLAKYGGKLVSNLVEYGSPNRLRVHEIEGWPTPMAAKTAGVLWELNDGTIVFVAVDGGRYEISVSSDPTPLVEAGAGPAASWPPPMQHALLDVDSIRGLAKGGAVPEATGKEVEKTDDGWFNCVNDIWKNTKTQLDKTEASASSANDKWGRMNGIQKSAELSVPTKCGPEQKKLDAWLVTFIESRSAQRKALYDKMSARLK